MGTSARYWSHVQAQPFVPRRTKPGSSPAARGVGKGRTLAGSATLKIGFRASDEDRPQNIVEQTRATRTTPSPACDRDRRRPGPYSVRAFNGVSPAAPTGA